MAKFSNTPLNVTVEITGVPIGTQVFVASASVTNVANDFPFAKVALGYKTDEGKKKRYEMSNVYLQITKAVVSDMISANNPLSRPISIFSRAKTLKTKGFPAPRTL